MKKRLLSLVIILIMLLAFASSSYAVSIANVVDSADLLSDEEEIKLSEMLLGLSEDIGCDIAVLTEESIGGMDVGEYAERFYVLNECGYGDEDTGILLLLSMEERDWYVCTHGDATRAISDRDIDDMADKFVSYLSDGEYYDGFIVFAEESYELMGDYYSGERSGIRPPSVIAVAVSLGIAALVGLIIVSVMKSKMKTVRPQNTASDYTRKGSMVLTRKSDLFLYFHVTKTPRPKSNSSSSSGGFGGKGGKF